MLRREIALRDKMGKTQGMMLRMRPPKKERNSHFKLVIKEMDSIFFVRIPELNSFSLSLKDGETTVVFETVIVVVRVSLFGMQESLQIR